MTEDPSLTWWAIEGTRCLRDLPSTSRRVDFRLPWWYLTPIIPKTHFFLFHPPAILPLPYECRNKTINKREQLHYIINNLFNSIWHLFKVTITVTYLSFVPKMALINHNKLRSSTNLLACTPSHPLNCCDTDLPYFFLTLT